MASRVNIKLVIALIAGLLAVGGGGVYLYNEVLNKDASDNAAEGDKAMAAGDYGLARRMYARAVNKEPNSVEWLTKWREAIVAWTPATETDFENEFRMAFVPMLRGLAFAQPNNPAAAHEYLGLLYEQAVGLNYDRGAVDYLDSETAQLLVRMQGADPSGSDRLTVRRYRGLIYVGLLQNNRVVPDDKRVLAEEDLLAVLDVDPMDGEASVGLMRLMESRAREAKAAGRRERYLEHRAAGMKVLDDHLARDPGDPAVRLNKLALEVDSAQEAAVEGKVGVERIRAASSAPRAFESKVVDLAQVLATTEQAIDAEMVRRFRSIEAVVMPQNNSELTLDVLENLVSRAPDDSRVLMTKAEILADRRDFEEASTALGRVANLPAKPVGAEGMVLNRQKVASYWFRADLELRLRSTLDETEEAGRRAALERAGVARVEYAKRVPEDNSMLLFLDASLAEASGDLRRAQTLIQRFNQVTTNADIRGLWFEGQVSRRLGEHGRAKSAFEKILGLQPDNLMAMMMIAATEEALLNPQRALELYRQMAQLDPDNEAVRGAIGKLEVQLGLAQSDDPVEQVLINAQLAVAGKDGQPGSLAEAVRVLREGAEKNSYSSRIALQLANYLLATGDLEGAREAVSRSAGLYPDDERLARVNRALQGQDLFEVSMMLTEVSEAPELDKKIARYTLCVQHQRAEQAGALLGELAAEAPGDQRVITLRFLDALGSGQVEQARQIYQSALDGGLLSFGGLTMRARLESVEGKHQDAINTLTRAIELGADQANVWRLLGSEQFTAGQLPAATESYRRACEIEPNDLQNVKPLLDLLIRGGMGEEALRRAREAERFGRTDPQFVNIWLQLEARAGGQDGMARAILVREQRAALSKSDRLNLMELASLYMDVASSNLPNVSEQTKKDNWAKARVLIDDLRQSEDEPDLRVVMLQARWFADQGRIQHDDGTVSDGIDDARGVFVEYIVGLGDKATAVPYIELARFMTQRGRYGIAKQALVGAREYQSEGLEAEKVLAALHMELGEHGDAEPLFQKIVEAGADDDQESYRIRWIEMLLRQGKYDQAGEQISSLGAGLSDNLTVLLQRADVADGKGDSAESARLLDRAVSLYSNNPLAYTRRAEFRVRNPAMITDVLADLQQALTLNPNDTQTLRLRAGVYGSQERYEEMLGDLVAALRADPYQTDVLQAVMVEYILRKQDGRAMDIVEETLRSRPRDLMLIARAGRVFDDRQLWERSAVLYERGWKLSGDVGFGLAYINALISQTPSKTQIADRTLREIKALDETLASEWQVVFADAAIRFKGERRDEAETGLLQQYPQLVETPETLAKWWRNMRGLYVGQEARLEAFTRRLLAEQPPDSAGQTWARVFLAQILVETDSGRSEGHQMLESLMELGPTSPFAMIAYRQAGSAYYGQEQYEQALAAWTRGLDAFPGDWEMCNNAAFTLATRLERPAEGLLFAQSAVAANPEQAEVYDTLARVHLGMKDLDAASADLDLARRYVRSKRAEMSVTITQSELDLRNRKTARARRVLERALLGIMPLPDLRQEFEAPIRDLLRRIDSLEG